MPLSSLLHHTWSGWIARYLWKLLRCSGDCATRSTSGSRVLLLTAVQDMCPLALGEWASVLLEVITALSSIMEPFIWMCGWGGLGWTWLRHLPHLHALLCSLCHLQQGSMGKGTKWSNPPHLKHLQSEVLNAVASRMVAIKAWSVVVKGQLWWAHIAQNLMSYICTADQMNFLSCCMIKFL